jgi:glutathione reductase (NADPH)
MSEKFDLVVIGTGAAGSTAASRCQAAGWKVAIVDSRPFGGTCALRGCDPKRVLVGAADLHDWAQRMRTREISSESLSINWPALMQFKRTFTDPVPANREASFSKAGIQTFHGRARFIDRNTVQVGTDVISAKHIVVASGAMPAPLRIPGEEYLMSSEQFLDLDRLPDRILFVGGGYISFEFAHLAAEAGAQVTILHRGPWPLEHFDPDLVDELVALDRESSIDILLNSTVRTVERKGDRYVVTSSGSSAGRRFEADMVIHGAGRVPEIDDLDLTAAGIERDGKGILVNEYLQCPANPSVYAAGDAASTAGMPLTPVAGMEGDVVASNLLDGNHRKADYAGIPTVVFTSPPLASVGMLERQARERGLKYRVNHQNTTNWYSSKRTGIRRSGFKVLIEEETERILGAHLLGSNAEEVINIFGLAIRTGLRAEHLRQMVYSYPTSASDIPYML